MTRFASATLVLVAALVVAMRAPAAVPYPANPRPCAPESSDPECIAATDFSRYLFLAPGVLPDDYRGGSVWKYSSEPSGNAAIDANPQELFGVTGASVDRAWQTTTGRPDVVIAVLDSGIRWGERLPDLVDKFYLNRGELPVPQGSDNATDPYDRNGDGVFNLADYRADDTYAGDGRVSDENGNGLLDPEDLIFIFSDGVDDDGNGYTDDISGWDFYEDDNDALDEVRYGHGTGESHDSGAEADNGDGLPGTCPNCLLLEVRVGDSFVTEVNAFARGVTFAVDSGAHVVQEALGTLNQSRFGQQAVDYAYANGVVVIASAADEESNHHNYPATYNHTVQVNSVTRFANLSGLVQSPPSYLYLNGCTNYGAHIALSVPSSSCSSEATGRSAGVAGLIVSAALNAVDQGVLTPYPRDDGTLAPFPLSAEEVKQILIQTADDINFDAREDVTPALPQNYSTSIGIPGIGGSERFHSIAGFDQYFGYGRLNADTAVLRVASGQIPPEAAFGEPAWFAIIDPETTPALMVTGRVAANRAASYRYVLEAAPGVQPRESEFEVQASGEALTSALDGVLGTIDVAALAARLPHGFTGPATTPEGAPDPDRFTATLRVRVIDDRGNIAEDRRAIALHHDPDLLPGFPRQLGADGGSAAVTADLDADGREEIILGDSNGLVHAFRVDGGELPGWPVTTDPLELHAEAAGYASGAIDAPVYSSVLAGISVGDLDRDGTLEVVASDLQGRVYVWQRDGSRRAGFPVRTLPEYSFAYRSERDLGSPEGLVPDRLHRLDEANRLGRAVLGGVALGNLDGSADGSLELVAGAYDRHLYAWHHDGVPVPGWPVLLKDPAKVAAVDPDTDRVTLVADSGAQLGTKVIVPPSLGDLDGDGDLEVVAAVNEEYREPPNAVFENAIVLLFQTVGVLDSGNTRVYALHREGAATGTGQARGWNPDAFLAGWPVRTALLTTELLPLVGTGSNGPPALADVDGDGTLEIGTMSAVGPVYVFRYDGVSFFGRHETGEDRTLATEVAGPLSDATDLPAFGGLGALTLAQFAGTAGGYHVLAPAAGFGKLVDNQVPARQFPAENQLAAWTISTAEGAPADGQFVEAFPRVVNDLMFLAGPAVADIDGDGRPEALQGTGVYDVHAVDIDGEPAPGWPKFTNGWMVQSPAVGDVNGDGLLEVVATTREGNLFVWRTSGDECGAIPWRRWHHDEWGTGNAHTDARPPASLRVQDVAARPVNARRMRISLARVPGDGLFCGTATFEVRVAEQPIVDAAGFAAALDLEVVESDAGSRRPGHVEARGPVEELAGRTLYAALRARDAAGNVSAVVDAGSLTFPTREPTETPTQVRTPTATRTRTASPPATATAPPTGTATPDATATGTAEATATATVRATDTAEPTVTRTATPSAVPTVTGTPPATATRSATATVPPSATATTARRPDDGGCTVVAAPAATPAWWLLAIPAFVLLLRRRWRD